MSVPLLETAPFADLRTRAASRLSGSAAGKGGADGISDALSSLYALASSPETAPNALALLHELQVHQVEIDLQAHELQESRDELEAALRRQVELYDSQPVGCFTIDTRLVVQELNREGAAMLGVDRDDGLGASIGHFFTTGSKRALEESVLLAAQGDRRVACVLQLCLPKGRERTVLANIRGEREARRFFVVLADQDGQLHGDRPDSKAD